MLMNALSVDVEEYYHAAVFRNGTSALANGHFESRVEQSVERTLALLSDHHTHATFFILGEVALGHPAVVRKIAGEDHEVACHGDRHEDVYRQTRSCTTGMGSPGRLASRTRSGETARSGSSSSPSAQPGSWE